MAFPTTSILDNFNRDDEGPPPSANWTSILNSHQVVSNQADTTTANVKAISGYNAFTYGADCEGYVTFVVVSDHGEGVYARLTTLVEATMDGYYYHRSSTNVTRLYRVDNGANTQLGADGPAFTIANGDKLGIKCVGSTIKGYVKDGAAAWAEHLSRTDATHGSAGYLAMRNYPGIGDTGTNNDFGGGTIGAGATYYQSCAGGVTFVGGLVKKTSKGLEGTLTPTGSVIKKTSKGLTGAVTFAGGLVKKTSKGLSGALTFAGSLGTSATFKQALSGALTFVGTLSTSLSIKQALSGALSFVGGLATQYTAGPGGAWIRWIDHRLLRWRKKFE